jgi:transcriptional regulator with XRE-family HTH domain
VDSIGARLRFAREAKKLTIKDVVKDSKISHIYIQALEEENFDKFPSETYVVGFLRKYSEYLKLDPEEMLNAYRGYKIGESDTPVEELTRSSQNKYFSSLTSFFSRNKNAIGAGILIFILVASIATLGFFYYNNNIKTDAISPIDAIKDEYIKKNIGSEIQKVTVMQIQGNKGIELVRKNEALSFLVDNNEVVIILKDIVNNEALVEILPSNTTLLLAIDKQEIFKSDDIARQIGITLKALTTNSAKLVISLGESFGEPKVEQPVKEDKIVRPGADNSSVVVQNPKSLRIVLEANFRQKSYLELYLDANKKFGGYVSEGKNEVWEANEFIQLKLGNAGGVDIKINGRAYNLGAPGQVVNKTITWRKDIENPNLYHIVMNDSN